MSYDCETCIFYREIHERHPYGSTYAIETLVDCVNEEDMSIEFFEEVIEKQGLPIKKCPYYKEINRPDE